MSESKVVPEGGGDPFQLEYVFQYAAENVVSGSYVRAVSDMVSVAAGAFGGLDGLKIADVGCGFGNGIAKLARFPAKKIVGIDRSSAMIELALAVLEGSPDTLDSWLRSKGAEVAAGKHYPALRAHLLQRQWQFKTGRFASGSGQLELHTTGVFEYAATHPESFDLVVSNHCMGWLKAQSQDAGLTVREAVVHGLKAYAKLLRKGGLAVVMGPDALITYPEGTLEAQYSAVNGLACQPLHMSFSVLLQKYLLDGWGIKHPLPTWTGMIPFEEVDSWMRDAGFDCSVISSEDELVYTDPVDVYEVRAPMWMGRYDQLTPTMKMALAKKVADEIRARGLTDEESKPLREQTWFLVLKKRS